MSSAHDRSPGVEQPGPAAQSAIVNESPARNWCWPASLRACRRPCRAGPAPGRPHARRTTFDRVGADRLDGVRDVFVTERSHSRASSEGTHREPAAYSMMIDVSPSPIAVPRLRIDAAAKLGQLGTIEVAPAPQEHHQATPQLVEHDLDLFAVQHERVPRRGSASSSSSFVGRPTSRERCIDATDQSAPPKSSRSGSDTSPRPRRGSSDLFAPGGLGACLGCGSGLSPTISSRFSLITIISARAPHFPRFLMRMRFWARFAIPLAYVLGFVCLGIYRTTTATCSRRPLT